MDTSIVVAIITSFLGAVGSIVSAVIQSRKEKPPQKNMLYLPNSVVLNSRSTRIQWYFIVIFAFVSGILGYGVARLFTSQFGYVYTSNFSDGAADWPLGDLSDQWTIMRSTVIDGAYHIEFDNKDSRLRNVIPKEIPNVSNFEVKVDLGITGGHVEETSSIGIIFRNANARYYYFGIRPLQGIYLLAENELKDGKWNWRTLPGDSQYSTAIKSSGFNTLKVIANGERLMFYINGTPVADIVDAQLKSGNIGVLIFAPNGIPTTFVIDNLQVKQLP